MKKRFTGNTRLFLCISGAIIAVALIMYAWRSAKQKKAGQMNLAEQRLKS